MHERTRHLEPQVPGPLVVAAAVLDSLDAPRSLLCAARAYPVEHAGQYELPGGKVEPGEAPLSALARELDEELSMGVRIGPEVEPPAPLAVPAPRDGAASGDTAPAWPVLHGFRMRVWMTEPAGTGGRPRPGGSHEQVRWVPLDSVLDLPWLPADRPILEAVLSRARTSGTPRDPLAPALPPPAVDGGDHQPGI
ncbi:NUDIX domain-containing protein [Actinomyces howellii]|uniref:8-oxo-dGTP diphosphatase n=1 Tax=Actinomyces howellii TaxID=52771 RepID=A0A448HH22_9ACTO|nr:NUDIX domain-containing protein [Actinomyces howellii]VEG28268.1 CTP pyrophosphohydrolase [Actinomyces howellii]